MKKCIIILGMHRSGTSALAGLLKHIDIKLGKNLLAENIDQNPKGFFENKKIIKINDEILKANNLSWDSASLFPCKTWWEDEKYRKHKKDIHTFLNDEFADDAIFAMKDPRLCRVLPLWLSALNNLEITPYIITILRNPEEVFLSLQKRNAFSRDQSYLLWFLYLLEAELYSRNYNREFITFENLLNDPINIVEKIITFCDLSQENYFDMHNGVLNFLEKKLKHHTCYLSETTIPEIIKFYNILICLCDNENNELLSQIDQLRNSFTHYMNFFYHYEAFNPILAASSTLFFDLGDGFSAEHKISKKFFLSKNRYTLQFDVSHYNDIRCLRWDPLERYFVTLAINEIRIKTKNQSEQIVNKDTLTSNGLATEHALQFFTTDPQIFIPVDTDLEMEWIKITFDIINIETNYISLYNFISKNRIDLSAKDHKISEMKSVIDGQEEFIKQLKSSLTWKIGSVITLPGRVILKK